MLASIPFLGVIKTFFVANASRIVYYTVSLMIISVSAFALTLWVQKKTLEEEKQALTTAVTVTKMTNNIQHQTIEMLSWLRMQDSKAITNLTMDIENLKTQDLTARKKLSILEKTNDDVRKYMDRPLPDDLACLLNNTCAPTSAVNPSGESTTPRIPVGGVQRAGTISYFEKQRFNK